jgi:precorrin-6A synthase
LTTDARDMRELILVGMGAGNPDHLTVEGARAIREADLILLPRKGMDKSDLADLRLRIVATVTEGRSPPVAAFDIPRRNPHLPYLEAVERWHDAIAAAWLSTLAEAREARRIALLVWGDPALYDSTLRIAARLTPRPAVRVIPGITALQALTAAHAIPLATLGGSVTITTGRRLRAGGWPAGAETVAVMLDGACAFRTLPQTDLHIWWGAYLGMPEQLLRAGPLHEISATIVDLRAKARADHGWIMDTYLLRHS